jgi:hypothetical protein
MIYKSNNNEKYMENKKKKHKEGGVVRGTLGLGRLIFLSLSSINTSPPTLINIYLQGFSNSKNIGYGSRSSLISLISREEFWLNKVNDFHNILAIGLIIAIIFGTIIIYQALYYVQFTRWMFKHNFSLEFL